MYPKIERTSKRWFFEERSFWTMKQADETSARKSLYTVSSLSTFLGRPSKSHEKNPPSMTAKKHADELISTSPFPEALYTLYISITLVRSAGK